MNGKRGWRRPFGSASVVGIAPPANCFLSSSGASFKWAGAGRLSAGSLF